jgi:hypothetical protein
MLAISGEIASPLLRAVAVAVPEDFDEEPSPHI